MLTKQVTINSLHFDESDCCGNGCANCVLNVKPQSSFDECYAGKQNVILDYSKFKLIKKENYQNLDDVVDLHFKWIQPPNSDPSEFVLDIPAGHHIMMRVLDKDNHVLRPYSPYWVDALNCEFKILVNFKPNGFMSQFIKDLTNESEIIFRGPIGSFKHEKSTAQLVCIVAQGVAVAPTIRIIDQILADETDDTRILHCICASDLNHTYFRTKLREFCCFWNYKNVIFLSRESNDLEQRLLYKETVKKVKLRRDILNEQFKNYQNLECIFIIAGTAVFQNEILSMVESCQLNVKEENIILL